MKNMYVIILPASKLLGYSIQYKSQESLSHSGKL